MTWWVRRIDQGGQIPVPMDRPVQCIDTHDVASFAVQAAGLGASGTFDITSQPCALLRLLTTIQDRCCASCEFVPVTDQTLIAAKIGP